jgi:retron-type reverse transcriptase
MSGSADPRKRCLDDGRFAHGRPILGRISPGESPKARPLAKPGTASGPQGAGAEHGSSDFLRLTSLPNLFACWQQARRNKSARARVQRFNQDPLRYLLAIQQRLRDGTFTFGPYKEFVVREKKFRNVVDAPMKDRVVHWMLYQHLLPIWQPRMIHDTFGNLPGRGTHAAVQRLAQFARAGGEQWVLQLDISKYFYSVRHSLLKARVLRYIGDQALRTLLVSLIDSYRTGSLYNDLFTADSPYRRTRDKGMPIGNLSSQLFANIYLCDFDHWVKQDLGARRYVRYVDDLAFVSDSPDELRAIRESVITRLAGDGLTINPRKVRLAPARAGVPFLGYVVWPSHVSAGAYVRGRYLRCLREHESGGRDRAEALRAYDGLLRHTGSTIFRPH